MMVTGLPLFQKSSPLDGLSMKSHPQDSESVEPVSFGEILKIKEKQLQEEQEINGSSVAVALAALQIPSIRLPMLEFGLSDRSEKVDTQADLQLETPEPRSSNAGMDQAPMRSAPDVVAAPTLSIDFSGSGSLTDIQTSETGKQSIPLKETFDAVASATIPAEALQDTTQSITNTETFAMPTATGLSRTVNTMRMATLPTGNEEATQQITGHGLVAEILSQRVAKQTDNMTGAAKVIEAPGLPAKAVVETQTSNVDRSVSSAKIFEPAADGVKVTDRSNTEASRVVSSPSIKSSADKIVIPEEISSDEARVAFRQNTVVTEGRKGENQTNGGAQENHIPSIQPDMKHEDVSVGTRTTEMPNGVTVANTEVVRDQQTLTKNWDTLVSEVSTPDTRVDDQASEVFTGPVANAESSARASIAISVESLSIQPAADRKDITASGQTMEKQAAVFEPSPENLQRANQTGDGLTDSEVSDYVAINNAQAELAQSHTNENRLSSASLPRIQFNENHEGVEAQTGTDSIDTGVLRSSVQQNSIHETKAAEQKASVAIPNSVKPQTISYAAESTSDSIATTNPQGTSEPNTLPPLANANSETATIAAEKTRTHNNTYTQIVEDSQPHVKESATQTDTLEAYNQGAVAELEYPTTASEYEMDIAGDPSVVDSTLVQKSIKPEASKDDLGATAQGSTSLPKAEKALQSAANPIDATEQVSSDEIHTSFTEYKKAYLPISGEPTTPPVHGVDKPLSRPANDFIADGAGIDRELRTVETRGVLAQPALNRAMPDTAQEQLSAEGLTIQHKANQEKIVVAVPVARNPKPAVEMENQSPDPIVLPNPVISGESDGEITRPMPDTDFAALQPGRFKIDQQMVEQQTSVAADAPVDFSQPPTLDLVVDLKSQNLNSISKDSNPSNVVADFVDAISPDSTPIGAVQLVTTEQDNMLKTETAKQSVTAEISVMESTQTVFHASESPANSVDDVDFQMQGETKEGFTLTGADSETPTLASFEAAVKASPGPNNIKMEDVTVETSRTISQSDHSASIAETADPDIKVSVIPTDSSEVTNHQGIGGTETQTSERAEKTNISPNPAKIDPAFVQNGMEPEDVNIETEAKASRVSVSTTQAPQSMAAQFATLKIASVDEEIEVESQPAIQTNAARATATQSESDFPQEQTVESPNTLVLESQDVELELGKEKPSLDVSQLDSDVHTSPTISSDQSSDRKTENMKMQSAPAQTEVPATNNADLPEVVSSQIGADIGMPGGDVPNHAEHFTAIPTVVSEADLESTTKIPGSTSADSSLGIHRQSVSSIRPEVEVQDFPTVTANADKTLHETSLPSSSAVNAETSVSLGSKSSIKVDHGKEALDTDKPQAADEKTAPIHDHRSTETVEPPAMGTNFAKEAVVGHSKDRPAIQIDPHAAEVVEQVIRHLNGSLKSGPSSMRLHLNPEEWGAIEVELTRDSRGVSVTFFAEQASTGKLLETQLSQLRQSLADSGVQLSGLNIGQHSHSGQEGGFPNQNTGFATDPSRQPEAFQSKVNAEEAPRPERYTGQMSEVDYLI